MERRPQRRGGKLRASVIAAAAGLGGLAAGSCGGSGDPPTTPAPPPPALDVPFTSTDLVVGDGAAVESGWLIAIGSTGWIYDPAAPDHRGTEWLSVPTDNPLQFRLGVSQVIRGLEEGLVGMRVGGVRELVIPPDLGFGAEGTDLVPPNATVILEIELVAADAVPFGFSDLTEGEGAEAAAGSSLSVHYTGWLYDLLTEENKGDEFDASTAESPYTFTLGVGQVIQGWDLGFTGMREGGRRRLVIPHELAYGTAGSGPIPPFATLLFEIELLEVN